MCKVDQYKDLRGLKDDSEIIEVLKGKTKDYLLNTIINNKYEIRELRAKKKDYIIKVILQHYKNALVWESIGLK